MDVSKSLGKSHCPPWHDRPQNKVGGNSMKRLLESHPVAIRNSLIIQPRDLLTESYIEKVNSRVDTDRDPITLPATLITESAILQPRQHHSKQPLRSMAIPGG
jgi:hypothetical protein